MLFLIDEDVPKSAGYFLRERGHEVLFAEEDLGKSTPDPIVCAYGNSKGATVLTFDKDIRKLASRTPEGNRTRFRKLGRIRLECDKPATVARLKAAIVYIEFAFEEAQKRPDKRLMARITNAGVYVDL